jgi:hypothetical protein
LNDEERGDLEGIHGTAELAKVLAEVPDPSARQKR